MSAFIDFLRKLIQAPIKLYLIVMGAVTALGALLVALLPAKFASALTVLPLVAAKVPVQTEDPELVSYKPLFQHWAILLVLVGLFMVAAAFRKEWERPAMAISGVEKAFIALFGWILYPGAFVTLPGLLLDTVGAVYSLLYFVLQIQPVDKGGADPGSR